MKLSLRWTATDGLTALAQDDRVILPIGLIGESLTLAPAIDLHRRVYLPSELSSLHPTASRQPMMRLACFYHVSITISMTLMNKQHPM